jgi:hypothetical protein
MVVMRLVVVVLLAACWRGGGPVSEGTRGVSAAERRDAVSFVVRVHGLAELQRSTAALEPKLAAAVHRILRLANEAARLALRDALRALARDVVELAARARGARLRGDDPIAIRDVERKLGDAVATLAKLRQGLHHANTIEELQALTQRPIEPPPALGWYDVDAGRVDLVLSPSPAHSARWHRHDLDRP